LSPAYDVLPALQNMGYQSMSVGVNGTESTLENALSELSEFGIKRPQHFAQRGVCPTDMAQLHASIDRDVLKLQRRAYL
jgi:serine/threonine-protein kinase HipA